MTRWLPLFATMGWLIAAIAPWYLLDHQQHLHRADRRAELWPSFTIITGVYWGLLVALLWLKDRPGCIADPRALWGQRGRWAVAAGVALAGLFLLQHEVRSFARTVWFSPISPVEGDMLPLIQSALRDFWRDGLYPYRLHEVATWELPLTFTPGLWLPYSIPYLAGVDIRFAGVVTAAVAGLACIGWAGWRIAAEGTVVEAVAVVPVLFLPFGMLALEYFDDFLSASHLAVYWAVAILAAAAVRLKLHGTGGLLLGWMLIARVYMVLLIPFLAIHTWRLWQEDRRAAVRLLAGFLAPGVLIALPFFLWSPAWYTRGFLSGYDEQLSWHIAQTPFFVHGIGWTGLLGELGLSRAGTALGLLLQVPLWLDAWRRLRTERDLLLYSAVSLFVFLAFSLVPWFYIYGAPLIFLAFAPVGAVPTGNRAPLSRRKAWSVIGGSALLVVILTVGVLFWARTRDIRYGEFPTDPDSALHFEARRTLWGFDYHGWVGNEPGDWRLVTGEDAFVALPVRDVEAGKLEIALRPPEGTRHARVHLNHEYAGTVALESVGQVTIAVRLPPGNLFRGGNLLRIGLQDADGHALPGWELGHIQLSRALNGGK